MTLLFTNSIGMPDIPPFGKGRLGGIFVMRTPSKNLPSPLFAKEGYFRDI
jgi:hypothetical protein